MKPYKARKDNENYKDKIHTFQVDSKKLFDICSCKCKYLDDCKCKKSSRVSKNEVDFLTDQRTIRTMFIGGIDVITTLKEQKKQDRKQKELSRSTASQNFQKHSRSQSQMSIHSSSQSEMSMDCSSLVSTASSFSPDVKQKKNDVNIQKQMRIALPSLALACDRSGVSDRSAALIASSVLKDVGIITSSDQSTVVDPSKVRRERAKMRSVLQHTSTEESILGLYFDGRKDKTLVSTKKGTKCYKKFEIEDHYVIVIEPRSTYFGHVTCQQGTSKIIKHEIFTYCMNKNVDFTNLSVIGCDGTVINTGSKGGVICLLEETLNKPLHWFICQLHSNELPLRHLLFHLDGKMTGPRCFSGQIGKQLQQCQKLPVVNFKIISATIPIISSKDLSSDQQYLYQIMTAISTGIFSNDLSNKEPGPLNHSRWLTTASRILRLYATKNNPDDNLLILATFVMKVYGRMWFEIKSNPSGLNGPKHLWQTINCCKYLSDDLKDVVHPVIQRNAYFAHAENLILAMLGDENQAVRKVAYENIMMARKEKVSSLRKFKVPLINFNASTYTDIIFWNESQITEPPLTKSFNEEHLQTILERGLDKESDIMLLPCHTQAVERCVKIVTEASSAVCGYVKRDGMIRARLASRKVIPAFNTKKHFKI